MLEFAAGVAVGIFSMLALGAVLLGWEMGEAAGEADEITVTLTRLEARCLAGEYIELAAEVGRDFLDIEEDAQRKLRAALS